MVPPFHSLGDALAVAAPIDFDPTLPQFEEMDLMTHRFARLRTCCTNWGSASVAFLVLHGLQFSCIAAAQTATPTHFALSSGDRVVFYGDSITAQRLYTRLVEAMVVSRYPNLRVSFYNAGVSGDTVQGGKSGPASLRVTRDATPFHPTVVTVMLGMNDGHYTTQDTKAGLAAYAEGYRALVERLKAGSDANLRLTLIDPSPYDEISRPAPVPGYSGVLLQLSGFVDRFAAQNGYAVSNFNSAMNRELAAAVKENPILAQELLPDHIHPSIWGHWVLAEELAKTWGFDPLVSAVRLNASEGTVTATQKAQITGVTKTASGVRWSQTDASLPLPLDLNDPITQFLLKTSDLETIDRQIVQVEGLKPGQYALTIDGKKIATFRADQLAAGVNLALYETPMETQSRSIDWDGAERRTKLSATRLNLMAETPPVPGAADAVRALDALDEEMLRHEYEVAQPRSHVFELHLQPQERFHEK